jgi:Zn-dependent M28 family amino/carboxypeptidase
LLFLAVVLVAALTLAPLGATASRHHPGHHGHGHKGWHGWSKSSRALQRAVTLSGLERHLDAFQAIADANGGTRVDGTEGFEESVDYVARKARKAGLKVKIQTFTFDRFVENTDPVFERTAPTARTYVEGTDFATMDYSGSGDVTAQVVPTNDLVLPPVGGSTSGCEAADFPAATAGKIALVQRGTCTFREKADNAAAAGAIGVVIFNEGNEVEGDDRIGVLFGTLDPPQFSLPVVGTSFAVGQELATTAGATVHLKVDASVVETESKNVIADTRAGNPKKVVVVGAHLDSVADGPGINDNGTGSAAILEVARQMDRLHIRPKNRVRFAWWGAEEFNLLGSEHYVSTLSETELAKIKLNLNFDMIGSPNYVRFVYDGDGDETGVAGPEGSGQIEDVFTSYFEKRGLATDPTDFDGRSDYGPFIDRGIPAGGLFTGAEGLKSAEQAAVYGGTAGAAYDGCYHQACDTVANVNGTVFGQMADGVAHATWVFAMAKNPPGDLTTRGHHRKHRHHGHWHGHAWFR